MYRLWESGGPTIYTFTVYVLCILSSDDISSIFGAFFYQNHKLWKFCFYGAYYTNSAHGNIWKRQSTLGNTIIMHMFTNDSLFSKL